jgi:phosphoglycerate kinase
MRVAGESGNQFDDGDASGTRRKRTRVISLTEINRRLPLIQLADVAHKVVLMRVDHNVVEKRGIKDPYRVEASLGTLFHIVSRCGLPIIMTHAGRPRNKKTGKIAISDDSSIRPVVDLLERKLDRPFIIPDVDIDPEWGIRTLGATMDPLIEALRQHEIGGIYLPNTRWFRAEEGTEEEKHALARELSTYADLYVNDAFGSWQPHVSTHTITKYLPSYSGFLMQQEILSLQRVLDADPPFLAAIAGSKYDTKIEPLTGLYERVDKLVLGGVLYNGYLCAKYGIHVEGIPELDVELAMELVNKDRIANKIVEPPFVVESDTIEGRIEGKYRTRCIKDFKKGDSFGYFLDVAPESFETPEIKDVFEEASSIFINAVMGRMPHFSAGTSALFKAVAANVEAMKLFGGGDTLKELKRLEPGIYIQADDDPHYYFFTGGGTVLKAIRRGSAYKLPTVEALLENGGRQPG